MDTCEEKSWNTKVNDHLQAIAMYLKDGAEARLRDERKYKRDQTRNTILMYADTCKKLKNECSSYEEHADDYDALEKRETELRDLLAVPIPPPRPKPRRRNRRSRKVTTAMKILTTNQRSRRSRRKRRKRRSAKKRGLDAIVGRVGYPTKP